MCIDYAVFANPSHLEDAWASVEFGTHGGICSREPVDTKGWLYWKTQVILNSEPFLKNLWKMKFSSAESDWELWQAVMTMATEWISTLPLSQGRSEFCSASPPCQLDFQKWSSNGQNWDQPGRDIFYVNVTCVWHESLKTNWKYLAHFNSIICSLWIPFTVVTT